MTWVNTNGGRKVFPLDFTSEQFNIDDCAQGMAGTNRYGGQSRINSAQHSVAVLEAVMRMRPESTVNEKLHALWHDASDGYLPDIPHPYKSDPIFAGFNAVEAHVQACCYKALGVDVAAVSRAAHTALEVADALVCNYEKRHFYAVHPDWKDMEIPPSVHKAVSGAMFNIYSTLWDADKAKGVLLRADKAVRAAPPVAIATRKTP